MDPSSLFGKATLPATFIPLWNGNPPHCLGSTEQDTPRLYAYLPEKGARPTRAVILFPGGGYGMLAYEHEGIHEAEWYQKRGIAAFVLLYRLPVHGYRHPVPLLDAQRTMRLVRNRAAEWNIDPAKIAIMGFSAGGHLASTLATHFDGGSPTAADPVERESCRPDFAVLVYPVITLRVPGLMHAGSTENLLGPQPDPALIDNLSNDTQVTPQTPPTVLVHAADDEPVPIGNSRLMLAALQRAGVPCALQEYPSGGHGFGFGPTYTQGPPDWLDRVQAWLESRGFVA